MKLNRMKVGELKSELEKRGLSTEGRREDLVLRLRGAMESEELDPENYEFEDVDETSVANKNVGAPPGNVDMSQLMVAINQMMEQQARQTEDIKQSNKEIKQEIGDMKQSNEEMKQEIKQSKEDMKQRLDEKFLNLSTTIDGKLEKLHTEIKDVQTEVERKIQDAEMRTKQDLQREVQRLEKKLNDIEVDGVSSQMIQTVNTIKLKPPTFDGTSSFGIFKLQFETASQTNGWGEKDRVAALIVALKASAAEILQIVPEHDRTNYDKIMLALERKYGVGHRHELYRMELKGRCQRVGETLQQFAADIERLVHLAHCNMVPEYIERVKIDAFTDGIRDPDIRRGVVLSPKVTFAETVACALTNEAAINIIKPAVKLRQVELEQPRIYPAAANNRPTNNWPTTKFQNGNSNIRCWICDKTGHISRDCWEVRKAKMRTPSPMWRRPKEEERRLAEKEDQSEGYQYKIQHRKGTAHGNADALSRRPCQVDCKHCGRMENKENIIDVRLMRVLPTEEWTKDKIRQEQLEDPDLSVIIKFMEEEQRPAWSEISDKSPTFKAYWTQWDSLFIEEGCLKRTWESSDGKSKQSLVVVPKIRIPEILEEYHGGTSGGHLGINKTLAKIRERFYWAGCRQAVAEWCQKCDQCMAVKGPAKRSRGVMQQYNVGAPFERIAMDIAGPFPTSESGNKYVLVIMDYFSKWPEVYPIPNQETSTVANAVVYNWVSRYGVPMELHSDQGRNFESVVFQEMCQLLGINKTRTTPFHPQSDGMVERFNATLEEYIAKTVNKNQRNWDQNIPLFLMAYRSAIHDTTGVSPATTIFGNNLRLPADLKFGAVPSSALCGQAYVDKMKEELDSIHRFVRDKIRLSSDRTKARYDVRANNRGFEEGQLVWLHNPQPKKGLSRKFQPGWEGPYKVINRINDVIYRIQRGLRGKPKVVHLERLALYRGGGLDPVRDEQAWAGDSVTN